MAEREHRHAKRHAINTFNRCFEININGQLSRLEYAFKINSGSEV